MNFFSLTDKSLQAKYIWAGCVTFYLLYVCVWVCTRVCVCVHIYKYIFFLSDHSPTRHYCEAVGAVSTNVPELIPRTRFQTRLKNKQESPKNLTQKQTKPDKPHTELRSRLFLLLRTKGYFHILKLPYGTKDTKTSPISSIWVIFFLMSKLAKALPSPCRCRAVSWLNTALIATILCWWGV